MERFVCVPKPSGNVSSWRCNVKNINYTHFKLDVTGNLSKPLYKIWTHMVFHYRYNTYQKYAIDIWVKFTEAFQKY